MSAAEIEFVDPPDFTARPTSLDWEAIFDVLAARKGEWAKVTTVETQGNAGSVVNRIKNGLYGGRRYPPGSVQATSRKAGDAEKRDIYARFVGRPDEDGDT